MLLPPGRYLSLGSEVAGFLIHGLDGTISAELICVSGWHPPEPSGVRAAESAAMVRFRADAPVGTRINLVMRLAAYGRDFRIRICSGSGAEIEVFLAGGSEKAAVLSCVVEAGELVTANLSSLGATLDEDPPPDATYWMLKGILYFDPKSLAAARSRVEDRMLLRAATMGDDRRARSFDAFEESTDSYWVSCF